MATITSTQSGNFNATSTWSGGVVPVDGDAFVIDAGHLVTVNDDRRTTNGYDNSTIEGCLKIVDNGLLRMNGNLTVNPVSGATQHFVEGTATSGAKLEMTNGAILEIRGTNSDAHYIRCEQERYAWIECDGTNPNSKTTIQSASSEGATSVSVTSASGFAAGDWVSMFTELENINDYEKDDVITTEGAIIHDISSNNIYVRQFVSPTTTISAARNNVISVDDAAVFREGYKIIFGTGGNLNAKRITRINYRQNKIFLDSNISGSVVGETVYQSGLERSHHIGHSFQKVATPLTADAASGQANITVASTAGMSVGDKIWIEANNWGTIESPADQEWDYESLYTISSISNNTITLTSNLANARISGAWVAIWSRDTQIRSTSPGDSNQRPFIYLLRASSTDGYYRRFRFRNILFDGIGSNTSNSTWYRGVMIGRCSYENNSYGQYASGFEGNCWTPNNRGNSACFFHRDWHQAIVRNNIFYNGSLNYWRYSSGNNLSATNNISSRSTYTTTQLDGFYGQRNEFAYNLLSRSDDYGLFVYHNEYGSTSKVRHNYITNHEQRPMYTGYNMTAIYNRLYIKNYRYEPYLLRGQDYYFLDCFIEQNYSNYSINTNYFPSTPRNSMQSLKISSLNHNFRRNDVKEITGYAVRTWDHDENEWFVQRDGWNDNDAGWVEHVYVPAGTTVHIACEIKLNNFSGSGSTFPRLEAYKTQDYEYGGYENNTASSSYENSSNSFIQDSIVRGFWQASSYTSAANSDYERKSVTIEPQNHDYFLAYAVVSLNNEDGNANNEGWYQRRYEVYMDNKPFLTNINNGFGFNTLVGRGTSAVRTRKTRIGGRLR